MASPLKYTIPALPTIVIVAIAWLTPLIATGHFQNPFEFDWATPVADSNGVCCIEPAYSFIPRIAALLSPIVVLASLAWMSAIWIKSRNR
jgi:hypothetical protein